jgi:hypothetical protein
MKLLTKLNQRGHLHFVAPIIAIVLVTFIGAFVALRLSHAATAGCKDSVVQSGSSGSCTQYAQQMVNGILSDGYLRSSSPATINGWSISRLNSSSTFDVNNGFAKLFSPYGATDKSWVEKMQIVRNLPATGNVTLPTWQALCTATNAIATSKDSNTNSGTNASGDFSVNGKKRNMWYIRSYMRAGITASNSSNANCAAILAKVTTPPPASALTITYLKSSVTDKSATITWTTNHTANSKVTWDLSALYPKSLSSATLVTAHSVVLGGLNPRTAYPYRVSSTDSAGKTTTVTGIFTTTTTVGTGGGGSNAGCTNPVFTSTSNGGSWSGGGYTINQNVWNAQSANGATQTQKLYVCNYNNWYIVASVPGGAGNHTVTTYPEVLKNMNAPISSYRTLTSSYGDQGPSTSVGSYEFAYDIWVNGGPGTAGNKEVMIWNDVHGQSPAGSPQGTVTIDGVSYTYWSNSGTISFVMQKTSTSGTLNLLNLLNYLVNTKKAFAANAQLTSIDYGVEVAPNNNTPTTFKITNFSVNQ